VTDGDIRGDETYEGRPAEDDESEVEQAVDETPSPRPRRPWTWWLSRVALYAVIGVLLLTIAGLLVYDYGTMWPPSAEAEAQYGYLVDQGQASPLAPSPGFRIPIPGCVCHAADADLARKDPGHVPDVTLVMAHRYRTLAECFSAGCHGGQTEATEGPVQGEPENQPTIPAQ
jgi:hypothetical protein